MVTTGESASALVVTPGAQHVAEMVPPRTNEHEQKVATCFLLPGGARTTLRVDCRDAASAPHRPQCERRRRRRRRFTSPSMAGCHECQRDGAKCRGGSGHLLSSITAITAGCGSAAPCRRAVLTTRPLPGDGDGPTDEKCALVALRSIFCFFCFSMRSPGNHKEPAAVETNDQPSGIRHALPFSFRRLYSSGRLDPNQMEPIRLVPQLTNRDGPMVARESQPARRTR